MINSNQEKKLILFDFDYTLYNPDTWRKITYTNLAKKNHQRIETFLPIANKIYSESKKEGYINPIVFAKILKKYFNINNSLDETLDILYDPNSFKESFYKETKPALEKLFPLAELGIFTTNDKKFQLAKMEDVMPFFNPRYIYISKNKINILRQLKKINKSYSIILVDDLIEVLRSAKEIYPYIITVLIKQGPYYYINKLNYIPDITINNLSDLITFIK